MDVAGRQPPAAPVEQSREFARRQHQPQAAFGDPQRAARSQLELADLAAREGDVVVVGVAHGMPFLP
jgi:hypothetical protein